VEFSLEPGISEAEALGLLGEDVLATTAAGAGGGCGVELGPGQGAGGGANVLRLEDEGGAGLLEAAGFSGAGPGPSSALAEAFAQVRVLEFCLRAGCLCGWGLGAGVCRPVLYTAVALWLRLLQHGWACWYRR
jgi:hypothetical protein